MTIYSIWWIKKRLGYVSLKINYQNKLKKIWIPIDKPGPSFVHLALQNK
jgi:hypothetical protein